MGNKGSFESYVTPCSPLKFNWRFGGTCRFHLECQKISSVFYLLLAESLLGLLFDPEDVGDMSLRNIGWLWTDYMALYPRRQSSLWSPLWEPQILQRKFVLLTNRTVIIHKTKIYRYHHRYHDQQQKWQTITTFRPSAQMNEPWIAFIHILYKKRNYITGQCEKGERKMRLLMGGMLGSNSPQNVLCTVTSPWVLNIPPYHGSWYNSECPVPYRCYYVFKYSVRPNLSLFNSKSQHY
jgi:hypothetical protein